MYNDITIAYCAICNTQLHVNAIICNVMSDEDDVWLPTKVTGKKIEIARVLAVSSGAQHTALLVSASET